MAVYIVLLGPPGAGKGTQAKLISDQLGLPHISSGDIFRENMKNGTDLGKLAKSYMDRGELVPDDVTIAMIRERLTKADCLPGALLDGFPRTVNQAKELDLTLNALGGKVELVPFINVDADVLIERLSGRWTCRDGGHVFHSKYNPPKVSNVCDIDGSELYQRDDDKVETVTRRIKNYFELTAPLIRYYEDQGVLLEVDGSQSIDEVTKSLLSGFSHRKLMS
jgi:adenylate kinase